MILFESKQFKLVLYAKASDSKEEYMVIFYQNSIYGWKSKNPNQIKMLRRI